MKQAVLTMALMTVLAAGARSFEVSVWRGETAAFALDERAEIKAPEGLGLRLGTAKEVKYISKPGGRHYQSALDKVVWGDTKGPHFWAEVTVPVEAKPGVYDMGMYKIRVVDRVLPPPRDWKYFLDLWQHPWAVSRYFGVKPFSPEHYAKMKPLWELLASAGQKALTVTLLEQPWDHQCHDAYRSMIGRTRLKDGTWKFDYSLFDEYVAFGRSCGIGPDIACYTMCPWGYVVRWTDENGSLQSRSAKPGEPFFEEYWGAFLVDFKRHLEEKGWFADTCIAMDERGPDDLKAICELIQKKAPGMKTSMAGNRKPSDFKGLVFNNYSQSLGHANKDFLENEVPLRRSQGHKTTFYVCCGPDYPNTFLSSEVDEAFWLGAYPAFAGLDGFLRWAWNSWPRDPDADASFGWWKAGDTFFVYPDGSPSNRFLELREGIIAAEKVRILRESGKLDEKKFAETAALFNREEAMANKTEFWRLRQAVLSFVNAE